MPDGVKKKTLANPLIWGEGTWRLLHCTAATFPKIPTEKDYRAYTRFLHSMAPILPCRFCREHMAKFLKENPIRPILEKGRRSFMLWTIRFHNSVNKKLGKPILPAAEAIRSIRTLCTK